MSLLFFFPFGKIMIKGGEMVSLSILGCSFVKAGSPIIFPVIPLLVIVSISMLVIIVTILLYKKRILQIRLCVFNIFIQLGSIGLMYFYLYFANKEFGTDYATSIMMIIPLVAAILTFLAIRTIGKDEALVRSISRIR
jgi:hypothetical protein